jgi:hypothetical protein
MGPIQTTEECWVDDNPTRTDWPIALPAAKAEEGMSATEMELRALAAVDAAEVACEGLSKWAVMKIAISASAAAWRYFRDR